MKLVTVHGDSGLHLFCYVGGCGTLMAVVGKDHFAIGLHYSVV